MLAEEDEVTTPMKEGTTINDQKSEDLLLNEVFTSTIDVVLDTLLRVIKKEEDSVGGVVRGLPRGLIPTQIIAGDITVLLLLLIQVPDDMFLPDIMTKYAELSVMNVTEDSNNSLTCLMTIKKTNQFAFNY